MLKVAWMLIAATNVLNVTAFAINVSHDENICRARQWRCERRCTEDHTVGSVEHLKCNERCWEEYRYCREEGP